MDGITHNTFVDPQSTPRPPRRRRVRDLLGLLLVLVGALASMATSLADDPVDEDASGEEQPLAPCSNDDDCQITPELPHCLSSYELCVECLEDDHCDAQSRCFEHRCVSYCESNDACSGELICLDGLCLSCSNDMECADPARYCYVGPDFTACRPLCTDTQECGGPGFVDGDVCRAGHCQQVDCQVPQDCLLDRETCDVEAGICRSLM